MTRPDEFPLRPPLQARQAPKPFAEFQNQTQGPVSRPTGVHLPSTPRFSSPDEWPSASLPLPNQRRLLQGGAFAPRPDEGMQLGPRRDTFFPPASSLPRPDEEAQRPLLRHAQNAPSAKSVPLVDDRPDAWVAPRSPSSKPSACASTSFRYPDEHGPCCKACDPAANSDVNAHDLSLRKQRHTYSSPDDLTLEYPMQSQPRGLQLREPFVGTGTNWKPVDFFNSSFQYQVGSLLGRAIVNLQVGKESTSTAWLAGGPFVVASAHSRSFEMYELLKQNTCPTSVVVKGSPVVRGFTPTQISIRYPRRKEVALQRLQDLGLHEPTFEIETFSCELLDSSFLKMEGCRDIDIYNCFPKLVQYKLDGRPKLHWLYPSDLFGSIPVKLADGTQSSGKKVYLLSYNTPTPFIQDHPVANYEPLLSPNGYISTSLCPPQFPNSNVILVKNIDAMNGSSGGALLDERDNKAMGVLSKGSNFCQNVNFSTFSPKMIHTIQSGSSLNFEEFAVASQFSPSKKIGGSGGNQKSFPCPKGMAISGVVGSSISDDFLGNLGFICSPIEKSSTSTISRLHRAVVLTPGSIDTNFRSSENESLLFDHYINTTLSESRYPPYKTERLRVPQNFVMCPPQFFVNEVAVSTKDFYLGRSIRLLETVLHLGCRHAFQPEFVFRHSRLPIGAPFSRIDSRSRWEFAKCPPDSIAQSIRFSSGWYVDSFELGCKQTFYKSR